MKARYLGHVVFYVKDLGRSLAFYRDLLGFKEIGRIFDGAAAAVAIGYPGDPAMLPDRLRERELGPRSRKPLQDSVFAGRWGRVSPLVTGSTPSH